MIDVIRIKWPKLHRSLGKIYLLSCFLTSLGGLGFIFVKGTIGGLLMDLGFSIYGVTMLVCTFMTYQKAREKNFIAHRQWALRLFSLAIASWLYRMDYGLWELLANLKGHTDDYRGSFDTLMNFFFFIPNLILIECYIRIQRNKENKLIKNIIYILGTILILVVTYNFTILYWWPGIMA